MHSCVYVGRVQHRRFSPAVHRFRYGLNFLYLDLDFDYHWQLNEPQETLKVNLANHRSGQRVFSAAMVMHRRPLTRSQIVRSWLRYPWMTGQVVLAIYYEALRLWMKKCPYYPPPENHSPQAR